MTATAHFNLDTTAKPARIRLELPARDRLPAAATELCLCLVHPMDPASLEGARLAERQGDWHRMVLDQPWLGEQPLVLSFSSEAVPKKITDRPSGIYLVCGQDTLPVSLPDQPQRTAVKPEPLASGQLHWLPQPAQCSTEDTRLGCPSSLHFIGEEWNTAWLKRLWRRLETTPLPSLGTEGFPLRYQAVPHQEDAYVLEVDAEGLELRYRDEAGFQAGQAYVMQYLLQWPLARELPACRLSGQPRFEYRGVHLDVVRHFFAADTLIEWFDILALFQFNHFHWHLTDDDGWRVASAAYPEVTTIGAWRGHGLALPPQMGSGPAPYGGFYTAQDIQRTVERAGSLGIAVIPEMDIPGHARALLKAMPELVEAEDASEYRSVQHHNDNVLNPALPRTREIMTTLLHEWCELFPGALFHLGSDEVPEGAWLKSPAAQAWARQQQRSPEDLHGVFMGEMEAVIRDKGKTAMGWEEIRTGDGVSSDTWILSWQGIEAGQAAAQAGHPVVMTPAQHCYFDLAVTDRPEDPGYYWAGTVNLESVWHYDPTAGLPAEAAGRIQGVQACLWTEVVTTPEQAEFMWFPRLLGLAEVACGSNQYDTYTLFERRALHWMTLLAHLGITGRDSAMQW